MPVVTAATPTYPPQRLADAVLYGKGLTCEQSDDGGVEEFEEYWASRASSLATRASRARMYARATRVAKLEAWLAQDSSNSSKPPSSDCTHVKPLPYKTAAARRCGG